MVNFRTLRSLDGIRADLMNTISQRGDAYRFNGSLAMGTSFGEDRGHLIAAFSYSRQDPVDGSRRKVEPFLDEPVVARRRVERKDDADAAFDRTQTVIERAELC